MTPPTPDQILSDPACSIWLKESLQQSLLRDPVDALNDAEVLAAVLKARLDSLFARNR